MEEGLLLSVCRKPVVHLDRELEEDVPWGGDQAPLYQGCIFRLTCSHPKLTEDHVLTSAYVKFFRTVTRNAINNNVYKKKDCF